MYAARLATGRITPHSLNLDGIIPSFVAILKVFVKFLEAKTDETTRKMREIWIRKAWTTHTRTARTRFEGAPAELRIDRWEGEYEYTRRLQHHPRFQLIDTTAILFVMDQTQYSASGSIMPLETRDFNSYINVLEANEALAHFINEWYASDEGYEAVKKDNAADKRDRAE
ncbi:hypothetical protein JOM56_012830 [Amanita muscaria]